MLRTISEMLPILHLSVAVRDLSESVDFYVESLGCRLGRVREDFADVWFYGMQLTLHARPDQVLPAARHGVRHFGVTLDAEELHAMVAKLESRNVPFVSALSTDYLGTAREQTKAKVVDPSGNVIELKTYVDPVVGLDAR